MNAKFNAKLIDMLNACTTNPMIYFVETMFKSLPNLISFAEVTDCVPVGQKPATAYPALVPKS